jgi:two-component system OmpR family response regulator
VRGGKRVLVVEGDAVWAEALAGALGREGHTVARVADGAGARATFAAQRPDLVVLGLPLPDGDGLAVLADLKAAAPDLPVLVCGDATRSADRLPALRLGDGFAARPCDAEEVAARAGALLRCAGPQTPRVAPPPAAAPPGPHRIGGLVVDPRRPEARSGGRAVALTPGEHRLLLALAERAGQTVPTPALAERLYGEAAPAGIRRLPVLLQRLRRKLAALGRGAEVRTVRGAGLRLVPTDDAPPRGRLSVGASKAKTGAAGASTTTDPSITGRSAPA